MLTKILKNIIEKRLPTYYKADPRIFNHDVALAIPWAAIFPRKGRTAKFRLVKTDFAQYRFKPKWSAFGFVLFILILYAYIIWPMVKTEHLAEWQMVFLVPIIAGLIPLLALFYATRAMLTPIVFDRTSGFYWKSWKKLDKTSKSNTCALKDICALQIVHKIIKRNRSNKDRSLFELNIILNNKMRLHILDHSTLENLHSDAEDLAQFLGVPLWNGVRTS